MWVLSSFLQVLLFRTNYGSGESETNPKGCTLALFPGIISGSISPKELKKKIIFKDFLTSRSRFLHLSLKSFSVLCSARSGENFLQKPCVGSCSSRGFLCASSHNVVTCRDGRVKPSVVQNEHMMVLFL